MQYEGKEALRRLMMCLGGEIDSSQASTSHSPSSAADLDEIEFPDQPLFKPEEAQHFERVDQTLQLTPREVALIAKNGFVTTDRLAFNDFTTAYGYIYWKDLPVLVTTDSILHSIHQSFQDILRFLEESIFYRRLVYFLTAVQRQLNVTMKRNREPRLASIYRDLDVYLTVALGLLLDIRQGKGDAQTYISLATGANQVAEFTLFGGRPYRIDFTLFAPRGHYNQFFGLLPVYFRALNWLAQVDFRFVTFSPMSNEPELQLEHIAAAAILREVIDQTGLRSIWDDFDSLLTSFVGHSDNIRLAGLDTFLADAGINRAVEILDYAKPDHLLHLLQTNAYGDQQITGQLIDRHIENCRPEAIPRSVSFALMGSRFTLDSYLMSNMAYDRLEVEGQRVARPLPTPLDVMYLLGNDRAIDHLQKQLAKYGYRKNLGELRQAVQSFEVGFWADTIYNRWLNIIRSLNCSVTGPNYPQAMRTPAWADKMLHTQLASWAQLRHDYLLYVKQAETALSIICEYPDGYVEPYPEFFAAVADYANFGLALFEEIDTTELGGKVQSLLLRLGKRLKPFLGNARSQLDFSDEYAIHRINETHARILTYFTHMAETAGRLQLMAEKELQGEPFTADETLFLKSVVIRQDNLSHTYGGPSYSHKWDGWYTKLFVGQDKNPALIVDVHTNPTNDPQSPLYPPRVLHVGTGPVATTLFIANTDERSTIYVGPSFTYFKIIEKGWPPARLNDQDWAWRLSSSMYPKSPRWTRSFRLPVSSRPEFLEVPFNYS